MLVSERVVFFGFESRSIVMNFRLATVTLKYMGI
jgi:hypothetical protein